VRFISRRMSISFPLFASSSAKNQTKARRFGSQHLGVLLSVALVGALIFASGCGSSSSPKTTVPPGGQSIYVTANTGESVFPVTASGNVAPTTAFTVDGGTGDAHRSVVDANGNIYVTDAVNNDVTVYAAGATGGGATPTATISGADTGLNFPSGIALDASKNIYVSNSDGNSIPVYAAGATGDASVGEEPLDLGGREVGVEDEAGAAPDPYKEDSRAPSTAGGSRWRPDRGAAGTRWRSCPDPSSCSRA